LGSLPISIALLETGICTTLGFWALGWICEFYEGELKGQGSESLSRKLKNVFLATPVHAFILVYLLWNIGHVFFSIAFLQSFKALFLKLLESLLLFWITFDLSRKNKNNHILLIGTIILALISIDGIWQLITERDFLRFRELSGINSLRQIQATFKNPNAFAGWLLLMIFFPFALSMNFFKNRLYTRFCLIIIAGLSLYCLLGTISRGAWISFIFAAFCSLVTYLHFITNKKDFFLRTLLLVLFTIAMLTGFYYVTGRFSNWQGLDSVWFRFKLWGKAWGIAHDFNFLGCGLNTFSIVTRRYSALMESTFYPHNCLLQMLVEIGMPGVILFISIILSFFVMAFSRIKAHKNALHIFTSGSILAFFIHLCVETTYYSMQLQSLFWFILGFALAQMEKLDGNKTK
jgi:O-antigen ligase